MASVKMRIKCFVGNLPLFLEDQGKYLTKRKCGVRPLKRKVVKGA